MAIGLFSLSFAVVCAAVSIIAAAAAKPKTRKQFPDYTSIYQAVTPEEF